MIRSEVLQARHEQARVFREARPFRHVVIEAFLDPSIGHRLLDEFPSFDSRYALNEMGEVGGKAVRTDVRDVSETYRDVDNYLRTPEFLDYMSAVTGIPDLLYDPEYIGGGTHENRDGQSLDQHIDFNFHPGTRWHRRLNLIVYLNPEWEEAWGGALELQTDPWHGDTRGTSIAPLFNRAVIFETTEKSWHGFSQIRLPHVRSMLSRKSFAIYLYTRERPPEETATSHATVYVPDPIPPAFQPGLTLTAAHIADLTDRFARLRGQMKFLYEREKQFAAQIVALEGAAQEAKNAMRLPLQGYVTQTSAPSGLATDGWVGREFSAEFVTQQKSKELHIELWVPPALAADQFFTIEINDARWRHHVARNTQSTLKLPCSFAPKKNVTLRIAATNTFVPAQVEKSGDNRELAWKLLAAQLMH